MKYTFHYNFGDLKVYLPILSKAELDDFIHLNSFNDFEKEYIKRYYRGIRRPDIARRFYWASGALMQDTDIKVAIRLEEYLNKHKTDKQ